MFEFCHTVKKSKLLSDLCCLASLFAPTQPESLCLTAAPLLSSNKSEAKTRFEKGFFF